MAEHTKHTRFARYERGGWLATHSNVLGADADIAAKPEYTEVEAVYVPNAVAAAAPDLLEALKAFVDPCDCYGRARGDHSILCTRARKAITKAIGEDQ